MRYFIRRQLKRLDRWQFDPQLCPRRAEGPVPSFVGATDYWMTTNWSRWAIWRDWRRDAWSRFKDRHSSWFSNRSRFYGGTRWPAGWAKPRTCSFCGGVHPEDAIRLLVQGWTVGCTSKRYKRYLEPPEGKSPVPPVKIYTMHFDQQQVARFNRVLDQQRHPKGVA